MRGITKCATMVAAGLFVASSIAQANLITFDPDGSSAVDSPVVIGGLDLAPGNGLFKPLTPTQASVGTTFQYFHHASVSSLMDPNGNPLNPVGLNQAGGYELTYVASTTMVVTSVVGNTVNYAVAPVQSANSFVEIWYDAARNANPLAGTGYNDGKRIYFAGPTNNRPSSGALSYQQGVTGGPVTTLFDQFVNDDYAGLTTVVLNGSNQQGAATIADDPAFFITQVTANDFVTSTTAPFNITNPSHLFTGASGGAVPAVVPNLGAVNGISGPDTQVMADALVVFVPEPTSLSAAGLLAVTLLGARRRDQAAR